MVIDWLEVLRWLWGVKKESFGKSNKTFSLDLSSKDEDFYGLKAIGHLHKCSLKRTLLGLNKLASSATIPGGR